MFAHISKIMGIIHFRLNRGVKVKDTKKPQSVFIRYQIGDKVDFMASTKVKGLLNEWSEKTERFLNPKKYPEHLSKNAFLDRIEIHFKTYDSDNLRKGYIPSYKEVREHFKSFWDDNSNKKEKGSTIFDFIDFYITKSEETNAVTSGTLKSYRLAKEFLKNYHKNLETVSFDSIDIDWYKRFVNNCRKNEYTENYIGKNVKFLKLMLKRAFEEGWSQNEVFKHSKFKILKEEVENIYLDQEELKLLWNLNLSKHPEHEKVRDAFLIGCYTGLRVSDINKIKKEDFINYKGRKMLKASPQKTKKPIVIPLHPIVEQIFIKYDFSAIKGVYEQKINRLIKQVAEWAGIDETVLYYITRGGKKEEIREPKYNLIKTHTGRRSFCSNAYNSNMPIVDIMAISGHTSEKTFLNYIKTPKEDIALKVSQYEFFN